MPVQKIKSGRVNISIDSFIGDNGVIFFDETDGVLRLGGGVSPGGIPLASGGGGGGGDYILPTATTTVKGGVKIDGTTIGINNQVISVLNGVFTTSTYNNPSWLNSLAYSKLTGAPNLSAVATSGSYNDLTNKPTIPTNTNQLVNGSGFITSSALNGYATESYVTSQNYITSASLTWNNISGKPTFATVATSGSYNDLLNRPTLFSGSYNDLTNKPSLFSGSYTDLTNKPTLFSGSYNDLTDKPTLVTSYSQLTDKPSLFSGSYNDLTDKPTLVTSYNQLTDKPSLFSGSYTDLTNKPTIPTDVSQLTDTQGLLNSGTGGGTTYITQNVENPYTFSVAGDDSTLREILNGETLRFQGATGITVTTDSEGKVTITGPDLSGYATQSYVTGQGFITSSALTGYATETYVTTRGYLTTVDWSIITNKPSLFSGSYNDLTDKPTIPSDTNQLTNGAGYITSAALTGYATETFVTTRGYLTSVSWNDILSKPSFATVATSGSYNDLSDKPTIPTDTNQLTNGAGYITSSALTGYATETYVTTRGYLTAVDWSIITNKPTLSTVATSGSYTDLINLPTLFSGSYTDLTDKPSIPDIGNVTFTATTIDSSDSSSITFIPAVTFNSDLTVENDLIVANQIRNAAGDTYATESFVQRAVNELIGAAPEALNTLQELAAALGNDQNFATTIINALTEASKTVRYDTANQGLTEQQKQNARTNIGAVSESDVYAAAIVMG